MTDPVSDRSEPSKRPLIFIAVALAVISLGLTFFRYMKHGSVEWTSWALPLLISSNLLTIGLGPQRIKGNAWKAYHAAAIAVGLLIIISLVRSIRKW